MNALLMTNSHNHRSITLKIPQISLEHVYYNNNNKKFIIDSRLLLFHHYFSLTDDSHSIMKSDIYAGETLLYFFSSCTCNHIILLGEEKIFKKNKIEELSIIWRVECEAMKVGLPHFFSFPSSPHLSHLCKCIRARLSSQ